MSVTSARGSALEPGEQRGGDPLRRDARVGQVVAPHAAALGAVDAGEEGRDDLRSSARIASAQARTSASGWARMRRSSSSYAWPLPKMPTFDVVAAGSRPRSASSAWARAVALRTAADALGVGGNAS